MHFSSLFCSIREICSVFIVIICCGVLKASVDMTDAVIKNVSVHITDSTDKLKLVESDADVNTIQSQLSAQQVHVYVIQSQFNAQQVDVNVIQSQFSSQQVEW